MTTDHFDAIVVGTGFGGAVTACRLVEAGYKICVLERGRRYGPEDFPKYPTDALFVLDDTTRESPAPPPDFSRWLWKSDHGIFDVRDLDDAVTVQAAGYGGGSLIYANVHLRPPRTLFDERWPEEYRPGHDGTWNLTRYYDLAAYMLQVSPIPVKLAKTVQLQRAADSLAAKGAAAGESGGQDAPWFRTPLAINFGRDQVNFEGDQEKSQKNDFGRAQHTCDMRGRCCIGCDRQAKNTLDFNYLALAEDGSPAPDIRTLAEVTTITRDEEGTFTVTYRDLLFRGSEQDAAQGQDVERQVSARYVFLCAGSVNTTELLLKNPELFAKAKKDYTAKALGSHYFPNSDSLAAVFDCDEPHEADYGPTITSALLYQKRAEGRFARSLEFYDGRAADDAKPFRRSGDRSPVWAGLWVQGRKGRARLDYDPILDWGDWRKGAVGTLVLTDIDGEFELEETLKIGDVAIAKVRAPLVHHEHWFLVEDGGYPPDMEPLTGLFRSPLWLRRNRFLEWAEAAKPKRATPTRRQASAHLRVETFADALGGTGSRTVLRNGLLARTFDVKEVERPLLRVAGLLQSELGGFFPGWFVEAIEHDRDELLAQAAESALPMLGRVLDLLSQSAAARLDPNTLSQLGLNTLSSRQKREVLIRGMLRQALQVIAGGETAIADQTARVLFERVPNNAENVIGMMGDLLLWALAYGSGDGHTAVVLTMGRDLYRGRLNLVGESQNIADRRLSARLPGGVVDTSNIAQERILRAIARDAWGGELRSNPPWTLFNQRLTVHSQGGCPMGSDVRFSVTDPFGGVRGCDGLYVMDAAAFPASVGVNPSATIAAIAEFKIEHFIRNEKVRGQPKFSAKQHANADRWWKDKNDRRRALDPLNQTVPNVDQSKLPKVVGLTFCETMIGFCTEESGHALLAPKGFPQEIKRFIDAETRGSRRGGTEITAKLKVTIEDIGQFTCGDERVLAPAVKVGGTVSVKNFEKRTEDTFTVSEQHSFVRFFARSMSDPASPVRFFHYHLHLTNGSDVRVLDGVKVLRDDRGHDVWLDTATLYFEISDGSGHTTHRGILRLELENFLRKQLPSMDVTGTNDAARKSWALAAFYKYFATELAAVYLTDTTGLNRFLKKLLGAIHV